MKGFSNRWKDFPDYIIGITKEIWEDRGIATLDHYYAKDIPVRSPMGIQRGNEAVKASTMATINEFPDRELFGEDVIWSGDEETGYLSSHRLLTKATHSRDGQFGRATGKPWVVRVIADCAAKTDTIYDEWLVRDYGGMVRQMGMHPADYAQQLIDDEGGPEAALKPFTPAMDVDGGYHGTGIGREEMVKFWVGLRSSFPSATFKIHHQIGREDPMMPPRAAIRWSLDGVHDGWGVFGRPTGATVHVMGMCHAEYGPWGLRREFALYDEVAIWKQILIAAG